MAGEKSTSKIKDEGGGMKDEVGGITNAICDAGIFSFLPSPSALSLSSVDRSRWMG
jgi:hypothetical protein